MVKKIAIAAAKTSIQAEKKVYSSTGSDASS